MGVGFRDFWAFGFWGFGILGFRDLWVSGLGIYGVSCGPLRGFESWVLHRSYKDLRSWTLAGRALYGRSMLKSKICSYSEYSEDPTHGAPWQKVYLNPCNNT